MLPSEKTPLQNTFSCLAKQNKAKEILGIHVLGFHLGIGKHFQVWNSDFKKKKKPTDLCYPSHVSDPWLPCNLHLCSTNLRCVGNVQGNLLVIGIHSRTVQKHLVSYTFVQKSSNGDSVQALCDLKYT